MFRYRPTKSIVQIIVESSTHTDEIVSGNVLSQTIIPLHFILAGVDIHTE